MQYIPVYIVTGVVVGIALCAIVLYAGNVRRRKREIKGRRHFVEHTIADDWNVPSDNKTEVVFEMRFTADMVEKLHRMTILHKFESASMGVRRAIDIAAQVDRIIPNGGYMMIIDEKGVTTKVHLPKARSDENQP